MGANHQNEIEFLCEIAEPTHGLITNIGKAHIQGFGSFEGVIKTKSELYKSLIKTDGVIFYNSDNEILVKLEKTKKTVTYGIKNAEILGLEISAEPFLALKWTKREVNLFEPQWSGKEKHIQTQLIGSYNFENVLATVCIGTFFEVDKKQIKIALEEYKSTNNRSQFAKTERNELILDAYNANPSSMAAALSNFSKMQNPNKMVILGDMLELGEISEFEHSNVLKKVKAEENLKGIFVGEMFYKLITKDNEFLAFKDSNECAEFLKENKFENQLILIKGSRGIQLEKIILYL
jgi:UDP-N-acetylmuramoyl-tripeptide--D-alanyl-D-alanine ligase